MKNCSSSIITRKKLKREDTNIDGREKIQIAINLKQLSKMLNGLLWNRYHNEFMTIIEDINIKIENELDQKFPNDPKF